MNRTSISNPNLFKVVDKITHKTILDTTKNAMLQNGNGFRDVDLRQQPIFFLI